MKPTWTQPLIFRSSEVTPDRPEGELERSALILNPCDGYHHVFARWWQDGDFRGFFNFLGTCEYEKDCYVAWALLPDELPMIQHFDPK